MAKYVCLSVCLSVVRMIGTRDWYVINPICPCNAIVDAGVNIIIILKNGVIKQKTLPMAGHRLERIYPSPYITLIIQK